MTITIEGKAAEGKTAIAHLLHRELNRLGIKSTLTNTELDAGKYACMAPEVFDQMLPEFLEGVEITIVERAYRGVPQADRYHQQEGR